MPADEYVAAQYGLGIRVSPEDQADVIAAFGPQMLSNCFEAAPLTLEGLREGMRALEGLRNECQPWPALTLTDPDSWFLLGEPSTIWPYLAETESWSMLSPEDGRAWSEAGFAQAQQEMASWGGVPCPCTLCEPPTAADNVTGELMALVRAGDEARFRELAACVMPAGEVEECWAGAQSRLGRAGSPRQPEPPFRGVPASPVPQEPQCYGQAITEMLGEGS